MPMIIEGLKRLKLLDKRISKLTSDIGVHAVKLSNETSGYDDPTRQVADWVQSACALIDEKEQLIHRIHRTNCATAVPIAIGGTTHTRSIDEWIQRRNNNYLPVYQQLNDRRLRGRETVAQQTDGSTVTLTIQRHYDTAAVDAQLAVLLEEPSLIDSALEIVNATTELVE